MSTRIFDTIYIEDCIQDHPKTNEILQKTSGDTLTIDSWQEVFNRKQQNFRIQKASPKLILAKKKDSYLYPGSLYTPNFGEENFYYNTMVLNCIYDCEYCYLQGMFNSGNLLVFVNSEDFHEATLEKLEELKRLYLCISYETDLLGIEHLTGFCKEWLDICRQHPNLLLECRTKSVNYNAIKQYKALKNFIIAWTISPQEVAKKYERGTPSLGARLKTIAKAIQDGWPVRLCIDPVLHTPNWEDMYKCFLEETFAHLDYTKLLDISIGSFRMNKDYYKNIQRYYPTSELYNFPYERDADTVGYKQDLQEKMKATIKNKLSELGVEESKCYFF